MRHRLTDEEKVAKQLAKIVSDITLDLDSIGKHLAIVFPNVVYRRLETIIEAAEYEREMTNVRNTHDPLF